MLSWMQKQAEAFAERASKLQLLRQQVYPKSKLKNNNHEKSTFSPPSKKKLSKIKLKSPSTYIKSINMQDEVQAFESDIFKKVKMIGRYSQCLEYQYPRINKKWNNTQQEGLYKQGRITDAWLKKSQTFQPTNIQFEYKTNKLGKNSFSRASRNFINSQHFIPTQGKFSKKTLSTKELTNYNQVNESMRRYKVETRDFYDQKSEKTKVKDSQTLLRKNSLFLLSFVKAKHKKHSKQSHIGQMPALTQLNRIKDQNIEVFYDHYYQERGKTQKNINCKKDRSITLSVKKLKKQLAIVPQPW